MSQNWEYLVVPPGGCRGFKKDSAGVRPDHLNELGAQGGEAVGMSLKKGDLVAWPVVLPKRPVGWLPGGVEPRRGAGRPRRRDPCSPRVKCAAG